LKRGKREGHPFAPAVSSTPQSSAMKCDFAMRLAQGNLATLFRRSREAECGEAKRR